MYQLTSNVLAEPELVGRGSELQQLNIYLDNALAGKGSTVFVSGEAGAGKTRLVREFLKMARNLQVTVLSGWCLSNAAVPYFPFFEAFSRYFSSSQDQESIEIKNWLLGTSHNDKIVTPQVWKDQTFAAVANTLASIAQRVPVVLFIDDLQWADSASLALIHYLANTVGSEKLLVISTFRSEEIIVNVEGKSHPLLETIRLMRRQDLLKEIGVKSLDETEVSILAHNMLGGNLQTNLVQKLNEESQGNPLFIVESLRLLNENHGLILENYKWRLANSAIGIPPKIKDIILQRVSTLQRDQRGLLEVASVIGEIFDAALLANVVGQDVIEVIKKLDAIGKETSLVRCDNELYRFEHGRTCDTIYGDISPALKKSYHSKIAEALEWISDDGTLPLGDLAYHHAQAGNKNKALKYALIAGQDALSKWSNEEAAKHFNYVILAIGEDPIDNGVKLTAIEGLGDAYFASDNFNQAIATYELLSETPNDTIKLHALRKASMAAFYQGDIAKQKALLFKTESIKTDDRLEQARLIYQKGGVAGAENDWESAFKADFAALQIFDEEYAISESAPILLWIGYGSATLGKLELGIASALRSIALFDELGDLRSQLEAYAYAGGTFQACMLIEKSNEMLAKTVELNEKYRIHDYVRVIPALVWWAIGSLPGDIAGAISRVLKALDYSERCDARLYYGAMHGVLIMAYAFAGDIASVDYYYSKFMNLPKQILSNAPTQIYLNPTLGVYFAAKGEFEKSNEHFEKVLQTQIKYYPNPFFEVSTRQLYAWALSKQGKFIEAKVQFDLAQKIVKDIDQRFSHVTVFSSIMTYSQPEAKEAFPIRLDLINVSSSKGKIIRIENFPQELEVVDVFPNCTEQNGIIEFKEKSMGAFEVKTIKLTVKAKDSTASFDLSPLVTFVNELGETQVTSPRPIKMNIQSLAQHVSSEQSERTQDESDAIDILKRFGVTRKTN